MNKLITTLLLMCAGICASAQLNTSRIMSIGRNALYFEDYVLSMQYFNQVINVKPYLAEPYYYRAIAKYSLDDMTGAEADCSIALNINPFMINAYNLRGIARLRQKRYADALADFGAGLKYEPDNLNLLLNSGIANINLRNYDDAIADYRHALRFDSRNSTAIVNIGIALISKGDTAQAIRQFDKAIGFNSYAIDAYAYRGIALAQTRQYDKALADFDRLVELRPNDAAFRFNRSIIRYQSNDLRGAFADIDRAIEMEPTAAAFANRGIMRAQVGDYDGAAADFSRVLAIDPQDDIALFNRALIYQQTGQMRKALSDLNIIIAKHPDFAQAYYQRAQVKQALDDAKGAELDMMTAYSFEKDRIDRGLANARKPDDPDADADSKPRRRSTRRKGDNDIRKYDQMVVLADFGTADREVHEDKETIRGKVQNNDIIIDLEPIFALNFFNADTLLPKAAYFEPSVEQFNNRRIFAMPLCITNREPEADNAATISLFEQIGNIERLMEQKPADTQYNFIRGVLYGQAMNYNNAIADYDKCISANRYDINALFNRAAVRFKMVEVVRALESESRPNSMGGAVISRNAMGTTAPADLTTDKTVSTIRDYDLILQDLRSVTEVEPEFEFAYYNMAIVQCYRKQFAEAEASLTQAININRDFAEAYFNRGLVRIFEGRKAEGTADLSKAGELGIFKAYNVIKRYAAATDNDDDDDDDDDDR